MTEIDEDADSVSGDSVSVSEGGSKFNRKTYVSY